MRTKEDFSPVKSASGAWSRSAPSSRKGVPHEDAPIQRTANAGMSGRRPGTPFATLS